MWAQDGVVSSLMVIERIRDEKEELYSPRRHLLVTRASQTEDGLPLLIVDREEGKEERD